MLGTPPAVVAVAVGVVEVVAVGVAVGVVGLGVVGVGDVTGVVAWGVVAVGVGLVDGVLLQDTINGTIRMTIANMNNQDMVFISSSF